MRGSGGPDLEPNIERRRSRVLGRILDLAPSILQERDLSRFPTVVGAQLEALFPDCQFLVMLRSDGGLSSWRRAVPTTNLGPEEARRVAEVAQEVARVGLPAYTADFSIDFEGLSCCVPFRGEGESFGALYVALPHGPVATSEELAGYLRRFAGLGALALERLVNRERRRQEMDVVASETVARSGDGNVPLAAAKRSFERWLVQRRLAESHGNIAAAARSLQMDRGQLSRLIKRLGIDKGDYRPAD
ncbi:MAG: hypothetical protein KDB53_04970 [Planctomycetes bacterium]|nr:hypothetical protein [Planctomycetota bacterium]